MDNNNLCEFQQISQETIDCGSCLRCALRYLNVDCYDRPEAQLASLGVNIEKTHENRPCCICFGSLDDSIFEKILLHVALQEVKNFKSESFAIHVKLPVTIPVRDKGMLLHLQEKFPQFTIARLFTEKAFKRVLIKPFEQMFNRMYDKDSRLCIYIDVRYESDFVETVKYRPLRVQKSTKKRYSKNGILLNLKQCSYRRMKQTMSIPPETPQRASFLNFVTVRCETFHITGRYCKYSRNLPQYIKENPNGNSIEKIIIDVLTTVLGPAKYAFKSTGYDAPNERVLEDGRLFSVQIYDSYFTTISYKEFEIIEDLIRKDGLIEVKNFHNISKKYLGEIVELEKRKQKHLRVFCHLMVNDIVVCIDKINRLNEITVKQRTPIRYLVDHDPNEVTKTIYKIKAAIVENHPNLIQIEIITQTGVYVPEFIHGDLGRTVPSLCDILGEDLGLITTDVLIQS